MKTIAIINESSVVTNAELAPICAAIQIQVARDFAPAWGFDAKIIQALWNDEHGISALPTDARWLPADAWWLVITDTSDEAGALGYHDLTPAGFPLAKVFAKSAFDEKQALSVFISHEILEMLADPDISTLVQYQSAERSLLIAREICDPCGDDQFAYQVSSPKSQVSGVLVSDFVYPAWFHHYRYGHAPAVGNGKGELVNGVRFDHVGHVMAPFEFLAGGYIRVYDVAAGSWRDITDGKLNPPQSANARARVGSRRERRCIPRAQWKKSKGDGQSCGS